MCVCGVGWWWVGGGGGGGGLCLILAAFIYTWLVCVETWRRICFCYFRYVNFSPPTLWSMMMWGFHQQLQLSVEWNNITAVSVDFCQPVELCKLSPADCSDNVQENDVKCGNSQKEEEEEKDAIAGAQSRLWHFTSTCYLRRTDDPGFLKQIEPNCAKLLFLSIRLIFRPCNLILLLLGLYIIFVYKERAINRK